MQELQNWFRIFCHSNGLVTNSAHAAHVPARLQAAWAELVTKDRSSDKKSETSFEVLA